MKVTLGLSIGNHKFKISVNEEESERTLAAARKVNEIFEQVRLSHKVVDGERAALMTALRLAMGNEEGKRVVDNDVLGRIETILDEAMDGTDA